MNELSAPLTVRRVMALADGGADSDAAVRWARTLARDAGAELHVVRVLDPRTAPDPLADPATADDAALHLAELAGGPGVGVVTSVLYDEDPAAAVVAAVRERAIDTLVVSNAGMRGRRQTLAMSVANRISHAAPCTVIMVDTDAAEAASHPRARRRQPPEAHPSAASRPGLVARTGRIAAVFAKHGLVELFDRPDEDGAVGDARRAKRLRAALEELGPTFAKLGQLLSTRPDLLPAEYIAELSSLQDRMPPMPEAEVVGVLEQELGVPWEDVFESLEPAPLAAGTVAQVHRARLGDGTRVVVKVQRPRARQEIEQDLGLLELFAERAARRPALNQLIDIDAAFEHLSNSLQRELDFLREAGNIDRLRRILSRFTRLGVPLVHPELSTSRLLVMEEIEGGPISSAPDGRARREAGRQLLESYYEQILVAGFFHADPHPGNLKWWNDRIYLLDFGMVGEVPPAMRSQLMLMLLAIWQGDPSFLADVSISLAGPTDQRDVDVAGLEADLAAQLTRYRTASLREIQLGPLLQEMTGISMRHGVRMPAALALAGKALSQMQLVAAELDPELDPLDVAGGFVIRNTMRTARQQLDPGRVFFQAQRWRVRLGRAVEAIERLLGSRPGQRLEVNFRAERLEQTVRNAGRHLSMGLVAASALLGAAFTSTSDRAPYWLPIVFGVLAGAFVLWLMADLLRRRE
ncbi:MAG TPA: AarF/UbiB family protein [Candidatus Dormibacteraeota bacterium]|nr:AarF/UbiB family protein [Candidatus Dormibacteraeota bacterium]